MSPQDPPQEKTSLTPPRRRRKRCLVGALLLVAALLAAWFEPTHCLRGVLAGEPFYQGRPASWWAHEWEGWMMVAPCPPCVAAEKAEVDRMQFFPIRRITLGERIEKWLRHGFQKDEFDVLLIDGENGIPPLLSGDDTAALPVLQSLENHVSPKVSVFASYGIEQLRVARPRLAN